MRGFINYFPSQLCGKGSFPLSGMFAPMCCSFCSQSFGDFRVPPKLIVGRFGLPKSSEFSVDIFISSRGFPRLSWSKAG